jgi:hypothetical protein
LSNAKRNKLVANAGPCGVKDCVGDRCGGADQADFRRRLDAQWIDHFVTFINENDFDIGNVEPLKTSASWFNNSNNV